MIKGRKWNNQLDRKHIVGNKTETQKAVARFYFICNSMVCEEGKESHKPLQPGNHQKK